MDKENRLVFKKVNYMIMFAGIALLALGNIVMMLETAQYGFGALGLTVGPIIIMSGFIVQFFAIFYKPKNKNGNS